MPSACTICKRNTSCITCGKSVCVRVECSIAEEKEDTLGWEASRSVGYCLPCAGAAAGAAKTVTLPMKLSQLLWKMNLWTRSVQITSNQLVSWLVKATQARMKGFKALKKE